MGWWGRWSGVLALGLISLGAYADSKEITLLAMVVAATTVIAWVRWVGPHDHWREFRKRPWWDRAGR